jgi:Tol biopolymer transport system component
MRAVPMSAASRSKPILAALVVAALLVLPPAANAALTYTKYTRGLSKTSIYYAQDNGKGAHRIGIGRNSRISPNGEFIVYETESEGAPPEMKLYSMATGKTKTLMTNWREGFIFAWSPDSTMVATQRGGLNGPGNLVVVEVGTGKLQKIATGYVNGVSFSPASDEIAYGISKNVTFPLKSDIFRYKLRGKAAPIRLSHDHNSAYPLWGPAGQIVFARQLGAKQRQYGPKNELYLMNEEGSQVKQLTSTDVSPLAIGLTPTAWSESGRQLLTEFNGEDMSYPVAVDPVTGAQKALTKNHETGFQGAAISADGKTVLGTTGLGFGGNSHPKVVTVPFGGGKQKVLVKEAFEPSWGGP